MSYRTERIVRFGDVDHAGIVYYPRLLDYLHVAMEDFFRDFVGIDYALLMDEHRYAFPTVRLEVDFHRPLRFGAVVEIELEVERLGSSSLTWRYVMQEGSSGERTAEARVVTVGIDLDRFQKAPIPDWLRARLGASPAAGC